MPSSSKLWSSASFFLFLFANAFFQLGFHHHESATVESLNVTMVHNTMPQRGQFLNAGGLSFAHLQLPFV